MWIFPIQTPFLTQSGDFSAHELPLFFNLPIGFHEPFLCYPSSSIINTVVVEIYLVRPFSMSVSLFRHISHTFSPPPKSAPPLPHLLRFLEDGEGEAIVLLNHGNYIFLSLISTWLDSPSGDAISAFELIKGTFLAQEKHPFIYHIYKYSKKPKLNGLYNLPNITKQSRTFNQRKSNLKRWPSLDFIFLVK